MHQISKAEYMNMYNFIGAAMRVHEILGRALEEPVYQEALEIELQRRGIGASSQMKVDCFYDGIKLKKYYIPDFFYEDIIIEIKSVETVASEHRAQLFGYMRLTGKDKGILINFGEPSLRTERYIYQPAEDDFVLLSKENLRDYIYD